ncbi:MAG: Unknown protein [uncultured Sulfurovum sp.]|uniref:Lipoprotein n=1 Tax=uncultured Sulfurovum sp. TaxID=269237 RepID=A0A6S6T4P1_9BACT|nr:MAG: Unknown protein [uncultured Sulfurovum sp.]
MFKKSLIYGLVLLLFVACGTEHTDKTLVEENKSIIFPKILSVSLPLKLEANREMLTEYSTKSYDYETMQSQIIKYRDSSELLTFNLGLISKVLPSISQRCDEQFLEQNCTLGSNILALKLSRAELRALKKFHGVLDFTWDVNVSLNLGEVKFFQSKEANETSYYLQVDLLPLYASLLGEAYESFYNEQLRKWTQSIYWLEDNQSVQSRLSTETNSSKRQLLLEYSKSNNQETLEANEVYTDVSSDIRDNFTFIKTNDSQNTYIFKHNSSLYFSSELEYYDSEHLMTYNYGNISDELGFHVKNNGKDNSQNIVFFDMNGSELGSYGCGAYDECSLTDKSSWSYGSEKEENATRLDEKLAVNLYNLTAINHSLEEGDYLLIPQTSIKKPININQSVGFLWVFKEKLYAVLYDSSYVTQLENLKLFKRVNFVDSQSIYKEIAQQDSPTLTVETEILQ